MNIRTDRTLLDQLQETAVCEPGHALLGEDVDGHPIRLNFGEPGASHVLLLGDEQAGKTAALRTCALSLALTSRQAQIQLIFIAPENGAVENQGPGLGTMHYLPHALTAVATDVTSAAKVLAFVAEELEYRRQRRSHAPSILLFVDDLHLLLSDGGAPVREPLRVLLGDGARWGIYLIMAARPADGLMGRELDDIMALKAILQIAGKIEDRQRIGALTGHRDTGTQNLQGRGDFLLLGSNGPRRFRTAFVDAHDLHSSMERLHRNRAKPVRAQVYV